MLSLLLSSSSSRTGVVMYLFVTAAGAGRGYDIVFMVGPSGNERLGAMTVFNR